MSVIEIFWDHEVRNKYSNNWGQINKTFTSVAIVLESENNSHTCKLHL